MSAVLQVVDVSAGYGPFHALFDLSLEVAPGEAVAVLGANGAGKTTLARVASGLVAPEAGAVLVEGQDLTGAQPHRFVRAGVAHATEGRSVFASLTVEENLRLSFRRSLGASGVVGALAQVYEQFPALERRRSQDAGALSGGEQRMLSLARVLVERPKVLIADELSLGLAPIIVDEIYAQLALLREAGSSLLIVEQHVSHALALCDRALLLEHGQVIWEGPADDAGDRVASKIFEH